MWNERISRKRARAMQVVWSLAAITTTTALKDFPMLTDAIIDVCGVNDFHISPLHPCQYNIFGFAVVFGECSAAHENTPGEFGECIERCVAEDLCDATCLSSTQNHEHCLIECRKLKRCTLEAAKSNPVGAVSIERKVRDCFKGMDTSFLAVESQAFDFVASTRLHSPTKATAAPPPADPCSCDETGVVQGVATGVAGCARHGHEGGALGAPYCLVTGGARCSSASPSTQFPGLHWALCTASPWQGDLPTGCELISKASINPFGEPAKLSLKAPPQDLSSLLAYLMHFSAPAPATAPASAPSHAQYSSVFQSPWAYLPPVENSAAYLPPFENSAAYLPPLQTSGAYLPPIASAPMAVVGQSPWSTEPQVFLPVGSSDQASLVEAHAGASRAPHNMALLSKLRGYQASALREGES